MSLQACTSILVIAVHAGGLRQGNSRQDGSDIVNCGLPTPCLELSKRPVVCQRRPGDCGGFNHTLRCISQNRLRSSRATGCRFQLVVRLISGSCPLGSQWHTEDHGKDSAYYNGCPVLIEGIAGRTSTNWKKRVTASPTARAHTAGRNITVVLVPVKVPCDFCLVSWSYIDRHSSPPRHIRVVDSHH